ncbi:hypothetical protein ACFVQ4_25065 [Streptomyces laurentii]|uniref:hypothetical protein n=1 Tax=Streptomyces laurentii TaxID=39478 RepID=UPI0036BA2791
MTWDYAELSKEASRRGGPDALRLALRGEGVIICAAVAGAAVGGIRVYKTWRARRAAAAAEAEPENTTAASASSEPTDRS